MTELRTDIRTESRVEHINITVKDPLKTAATLVELFGWRIRWQGEAISGGFSVHVGGTDSYLALYNNGKSQLSKPIDDKYSQLMALNHIGIVVDDLDKMEDKVKAAGFETYSHADYEPGRRFYFDDKEGLEMEVISYATNPG